jgi:hypothetical protein
MVSNQPVSKGCAVLRAMACDLASGAVAAAPATAAGGDAAATVETGRERTAPLARTREVEVMK